MKTENEDIPVDRENVARYYLWGHIFAILIFGTPIFGIGIVIAIV